MEVFSVIVSCILVLVFTAFICVTLYTIVRDLLRRSKRKNVVDKKSNELRKEEKE